MVKIVEVKLISCYVSYAEAARGGASLGASSKARALILSEKRVLGLGSKAISSAELFPWADAGSMIKN